MLGDGPGDGSDISMSDWIPGSSSSKSGVRFLALEQLGTLTFELDNTTGWVCFFAKLFELDSCFLTGSFWLLLFEIIACVDLCFSLVSFFFICGRDCSWGGLGNLIKSIRLFVGITSYEWAMPGCNGSRRCTTTCFDGRLLRALIHLFCLLRECLKINLQNYWYILETSKAR